MKTRVLALIIALGLSAPAFAQDAPAYDVSGGYSFLRNQDAEENFHGWVGSVTGYLNPFLGITGEVGGNYKTLQVLGTDLDLSAHSFMVGPKFVARQASVAPFGQVLFGAVRVSGSILGESESATDFAVQPGGGVDFMLSPGAGIRVGADYRRTFGDQDSNEFRFHAGVVLNIAR